MRPWDSLPLLSVIPAREPASSPKPSLAASHPSRPFMGAWTCNAKIFKRETFWGASDRNRRNIQSTNGAGLYSCNYPPVI